MKVQENAELQLGANWYTVKKLVGNGAVNDVYRAFSRDFSHDTPVAIKIARDDPGVGGALSEDVLASQLERRVSGMARERQVLETLNRAESAEWRPDMNLAERIEWAERTKLSRRVIALLDAGDADGEPFLVTEYAPPKFERFEVESLADECRMLAVANAIASVMTLAHSHNLALQDFDSRMGKDDRICLRWLDDGRRFDLKIIDWNITGDATEHANDLFRFGGLLFYLFVGRHLPVDAKGQPALDMETQAPNWANLTEGTRLVVSRLVHRDPGRRYERATALQTDLSWWQTVVETVLASQSPEQYLHEQARLEKQGRPERMLAIADLAERTKVGGSYQSIIDSWAKSARAELDKEIWLPIAGAMEAMDAGQFSQAKVLFADQVRLLPPTTPAARYARIYLRLAQIGENLAATASGSSVLRSQEWLALTRAAEALTKRKWVDAGRNLALLAQERPETSQWAPVATLAGYAQAGQILEQAYAAAREAELGNEDVVGINWTAAEQARIDRLAKALDTFKQAQDLAPDDPDIAARVDLERSRLADRRRLLNTYLAIDAAASSAQVSASEAAAAEAAQELATAYEAYSQAVKDYQHGMAELETILHKDATQLRARLLLDQLRPKLVEAEAKQQQVQGRIDQIRQAEQDIVHAYGALSKGDYQLALDLANRANELMPQQVKRSRDLARLAQAGLQICKDAEGQLDEAFQAFLDREWQPAKTDEAASRVTEIRAFENAPLIQDGNIDILSEDGDYKYHLPAELRQRLIDLDEQIRLVRLLTTAQTEGKHLQIITAGDTLERAGVTLTHQERQRYDDSKRILELHKQAKALIAEREYRALEPVVAGLVQDTSAPGAYFRNVFDVWSRLEQVETSILERQLDEATEQVSAIQVDQALPPDLVTRKENLTQHIVRIREARVAIESALTGQAPDRFTLVAQSLQGLRDAGLQLAPDELAWEAEAKQHTQLPDQIRDLLKSGDLDEVDKAWDLLEAHSYDVTKPLASDVAPVWFDLVDAAIGTLKDSELSSVRATLEVIAGTLARRRSILQRFGYTDESDRLIEQVALAQDVADNLDADSGQWPRVWCEFDEDEHPIVATHRGLLDLANAAGSFAELSDRWSELLRKYVTAYAQDQLAEIDKMAKRGDLSKALKYLDRYLSPVPADVVNGDTLQRLSLRRSELNFWSAVYDVYLEVEFSVLSYTEANRRVAALAASRDAVVAAEHDAQGATEPGGWAVSLDGALVNALQGFFEDLPDAAKYEHWTVSTAKPMEFLERIIDLHNAQGRVYLLRVPPKVGFGESLMHALHSTVLQLGRKLEDEVSELSLDSSAISSTFQSLYWQTRACLFQSAAYSLPTDVEKLLRDAVTRSVELLSIWCDKLEMDVCTARSRADLDGAQQSFDHIKGLIVYLSELPSVPAQLAELIPPESRDLSKREISEGKKRFKAIEVLVEALKNVDPNAGIDKIATTGKQVHRKLNEVRNCASDLVAQAVKQQELADDFVRVTTVSAFADSGNDIQAFETAADILQGLSILAYKVDKLRQLPLTVLTPHTVSLLSHMMAAMKEWSESFITAVPNMVIKTQIDFQQNNLDERTAENRLVHMFKTAFMGRTWIPDLAERTHLAVRKAEAGYKAHHKPGRNPRLNLWSFNFGQRVAFTTLLARAEQLALDAMASENPGS